MDPGTLIVAALTIGVIAIVTAAITWKRIIDWFRGRSKIMSSYQRPLAFTIAERINGNAYASVSGVFGASEAATVIVQGIYDLDDGVVVDARMMKNSDQVTDELVITAHNEGDGLVIYD